MCALLNLGDQIHAPHVQRSCAQILCQIQLALAHVRDEDLPVEIPDIAQVLHEKRTARASAQDQDMANLVTSKKVCGYVLTPSGRWHGEHMPMAR